MSKKKFTLIELLVVVAILGILMSLLLPALSDARAKTKTAVCINNHKQITVANYSYLVDNNDYFPTGYPFDDLLSAHDGRDLTQAEIKLAELPKKYESGIYHCPAADEGLSTDAQRSYGITGGSDKRREQGRGLSWSGHDVPPVESGGSRSITEVVSPSDTFFLAERNMPTARPTDNPLGGGRNAYATIQEYDEGSVNDFITGVQLLVSYDTHGQYKLTFSKVDGSARLFNFPNFSKPSFWFYDE